MVRIKICGITNLDDALAAVEYGADALGFVFFKGSPRYVAPEDAGRITSALPPFVTTVGVFVDESQEDVIDIMERARLDIVQFHGEEPPEQCEVPGLRAIKALRVRELDDLASLPGYRVSAYLLDTYVPGAPGGTGVSFNWDIAVQARRYGNIILAGGLIPDNVAEAVSHVRPYAVDVSSGVEAQKGRKDHEKLRLFIQRARQAGMS